MKKKAFFLLAGILILLSSHTGLMTVEKAQMKSFGKADEVREFPKG